MDLNRASIIGRLTRDPELRSLPSGRSVASFSVATNRQWKDQAGQLQKQVEYHNVVVWGKQAETAGQYLKKGARAYVEGPLQTREWTGQDGVKRTRTEIICDTFIMLDGRPSGGSEGGGYSSGSNSYQPQASNQGPQEVVEEEIKVEDIPF
jgi:single-strand DNA-binding protein